MITKIVYIIYKQICYQGTLRNVTVCLFFKKMHLSSEMFKMRMPSCPS